MAPHKKDREQLDEAARRLRVTRMAFGQTQAVMSHFMGSDTRGQAWQNYESGRRLISVAHAMRLCKHLGLTLDWIYFGSLRALPKDVARNLCAQMAIEAKRHRDA